MSDKQRALWGGTLSYTKGSEVAEASSCGANPTLTQDQLPTL